ncbi:MAG: alpha/beta hydrolase [Oscillibacter sp.]|nr:alpha/beta hydrolase [Oscillibacter sp.]
MPEIQHWYIAGHSMGGAMASSYAAMLPDKAEGLLLMDAYLYGDYLTQQTLTVYGTFNAGLEKNIYYTDNIVKIEGDNHAQFGNYGRQKGDPDATISADEQPRITVQAIADFITAKKVRLSCQTFRPYERSFSHDLARSHCRPPFGAPVCKKAPAAPDHTASGRGDRLLQQRHRPAHTGRVE